jgi:hypothetical protein
MEPVALGKPVKYVIRLAPKPDDETIFDLAANVEAWVTYDTNNSAFIVHVKPSVDVIRGRGGAEQITLSVGQCQKRMAAIDNTKRRHTQQIMRDLPEQIANARLHLETTSGNEAWKRPVYVKVKKMRMKYIT